MQSMRIVVVRATFREEKTSENAVYIYCNLLLGIFETVLAILNNSVFQGMWPLQIVYSLKIALFKLFFSEEPFALTFTSLDSTKLVRFGAIDTSQEFIINVSLYW